MDRDGYSVDWLRLIRLLTQYIVPGLVAVVMLGELLGPQLTEPLTGSTGVYNYLLLAAFTVLTVTMIAICGWTVLSVGYRSPVFQIGQQDRCGNRRA